MKYLIYTDVHFSQYSSVLRRRGKNYSERLENIITSLNWAEEQAVVNNCNKIICLGDFFDKPELNCEELSALTEIKWANLPHNFLVGNHESNVSSLIYSSTYALNNIPLAKIIDKISFESNNCIKCDFLYLPYINEDERKKLIDYIPERDNSHKLVIFSHNDLSGIQYGKFESVKGFNLEEIENNCNLFLNGHLHNMGSVGKNIINVGNLTGQNFSEDGFNYRHCVCILNIDSEGNIDIQFIENPFSNNFYKITINTEKDFELIDKLKGNSVVSFSCEHSLIDKLKEKIKDNKLIIESRLTIFRNDSNEVSLQEDVVKLNNIDPIEKFTLFIFDKLGTNNIVKEEVESIVRGE